MCKDEGNQIGGRKGWGLGDRETVSCVLKNKRSLGQSPVSFQAETQRGRRKGGVHYGIRKGWQKKA